MREIDLTHFSLLSHPFRMRHSLPMVPGISAALQSLATFSNPSGVKGHNPMPWAVPVQKRKEMGNDKRALYSQRSAVIGSIFVARRAGR
jgi:hypothetical protein